MRLDDRAIRDVLRQEAASVSPPADLWDRIDRELEMSSAPPAQPGQTPIRTAAWVRQLIAVATVAGIFWMFLLPAGATRDGAETLESHPGAAQMSAPLEQAPASGEAAEGPSSSGLQWPSQEIALLR